MKKEDRWVCLSCGNEVSGAVEFCPLCMLRKALAGKAESGESSAADTVVSISEEITRRLVRAELYRLRGVFLASIGADELQIDASFCEALRVAREQKSISLEKRADATYAEYRRQKASAGGRRGIRLPLWI
jgi:hypothetical protein